MPYSAAALSIATELHRERGLRVEAVAVVLREIAALVQRRWKHGDSLRIPGLGTVEPVYHRPRIVKPGIHHLRGATFKIPFRKTVRLRPDPALIEDQGSVVQIGVAAQSRGQERIREMFNGIEKP